MTVSWFDGVTITLECAFATAPGSTSPTWTDISAYMRGSITTSIGRASEFDDFQAGQLTVTLDNRDRRFDPNYTAGAYYPNVLPNKRIRLRATYNSITYDVFTGWVDGWPQSYDHGANVDATVQLVAHDALATLAKASLPESPWAVEVKADGPAIWWRMDENFGATMIDQSGNGRDGVYRGGSTFNSRTGLVANSSDAAMAFLSGTSETVNGYTSQSTSVARSTPPFTVEAWFSISAYVVSPGFYYIGYRPYNGVTADTPGLSAGIRITDVQYGGYARGFGGAIAIGGTLPALNTAHHVAVVIAGPASGDTTTLYVDGVQVASTASGGTWDGGTIQASDGEVQYNGAAGTLTLDEMAIYTTALSAARVLAHAGAGSTAYAGDLSGARCTRILDAIGWNATDRSIDTGRTTCQAAVYTNQTALAYLQLVARSEQGAIYATPSGVLRFEGRDSRLTTTASTTSQATYSDQAAASIRYTDLVYDYSNARIYNVVQTQRSGGSTFEASDATSITNYLRQQDPASLAGLLNQSDAEIKDMGYWRLGKYKNPVQRITGMTLTPRAAPTTMYPEVLGRKISERVTVTRTPQAVGSAISTALLVEGIQHTITVDGLWTTQMLLSPADAYAWLVLDHATFGQLDANALAF